MHAVMGVASGYKTTVIERFCKSIRNVNRECKIILFVEDSDIEGYNKLASTYGIDFIIYCKPEYHIHTYRFKMYYEYLSENHIEGYILICDVRDLIFAKDPFGHLDGADIHFFLEDRQIGRSAFNVSWLYYAFEHAVLEKIQDEFISCAGSTFGTRNKLLIYLSEMNNIAQRIINANGRIFPCLDQGFHNCIVHYNKLYEYSRKMWRNTDGLICTLSYSDKIVDSCVYHQFDRLNKEDLINFALDHKIPIDDLLESRQPLCQHRKIHVRFEVIGDNGEQIAVREVNTVLIELKDHCLGRELLELSFGLSAGDRISYKTKSLPPFVLELLKDRFLEPSDVAGYDVIKYSDQDIDILMMKPTVDGFLRFGRVRLAYCESSEYTVNIQFSV